MLHRNRLCLSILALIGAVCALNGSVTDYAPLVNQPCPNVTTDPLLRVFTPKNQSLHSREEEYVDTRLTTVIPNEWHNWIGDGSGIGYNLSSFNSSELPKIGIAVSGGGYRAAQLGAGVLSALDARNESGKAAGTGGLLQVTSYLVGLSGAFQLFRCLSLTPRGLLLCACVHARFLTEPPFLLTLSFRTHAGGAWLTGSLYMNDFPTIKDLVFGNGNNLAGWLLDLGLATPDGDDIVSTRNQEWYGSILWSVMAKGATGL